MNIASTILTIVLCTAVVVSSRRSVLIPFIMAACLVPMNQRIIVIGLDFPVLRILILSCMLRSLIRHETRGIQWNSFDKLFLQWNIIGTIMYVVLWGTFHSFIHKCGTMYDSLGMYWIFRQYFQSFEDIYGTIKTFALFAIISAPLVAAEKIRQASFYSIFGPVGAAFQRGRFRCAGPFPHYIMMGVFWGSLLPLYYAQIKAKSHSFFYWMAIMAAIACVYFSASSTPIMTILAIVAFWLLYSQRAHGKRILWSVCFILLTLHLIMNAPVWHLMARFDVFGGSTGWHRYHLFNEFINHTSEWFFLGTKSTENWDAYGQLVDITNQYVLEAVRGGFLTLFYFILILYNAVKITGSYSLLTEDLASRFLSWGICVSLLGHIGQILMLLNLTFAIVGFIQDKLTELETTGSHT